MDQTAPPASVETTPYTSADREGLACVLELGSRYGSPSKLLNDPAKYCDLSYGNEAR